MKKSIPIFIILIVILFTLTGCYYTKGIDQYYFIIALGLDKGNNGLLKISIQISSTSKDSSSASSSSSSQANSYKIYSVEAETIDEGLTILNNYLNKQINLSYCSAFVISEELAKEGIKDYFDTLSNNTELRHSCQLIISSSTAYEVLEKVGNTGEVFASRLFDYLTTSADYTGFTLKSTFGTFFQALHNPSFEPVAIYTLVSKDSVQTAGIAIFKNEYMVGHVNVTNSIAHLSITNELNTCVITVENPFDEKTNIDLDIDLYKDTDISIEMVNNSPYISLTLYPEGTIRSSASTFNYIDNNNITAVENSCNKYFEKIIKDYLYTITKTYNSDVIGFEGIYKSQFLTEKDFSNIHWEDVFKDSFFNVSIKSKINSSNLFNKE